MDLYCVHRQILATVHSRQFSLVCSFFPKSSLYKKIDTDRVLCWNEAEEGTGKTVFKAWEDRMEREKSVHSDVDQELLFYIPLVGIQTIFVAFTMQVTVDPSNQDTLK